MINMTDTNKGLVDTIDKGDTKSTKAHHDSSSSAITGAAAGTAAGGSTTVVKKKKKVKAKQKKITVISGRLDENSVLEGRGTRSNDNPGNVKFRSMVRKIRAQYVSTPSRKEKNDIVLNLVRTIQKRKGRFVRQVDSNTIIRLGLDPKLDHFLPLTEAEAIAKTKQAIRYFHYKKDPMGGGPTSPNLVTKNQTQYRSPNQNMKRNSISMNSKSKQDSSAAKLPPSSSPSSLFVHGQQQQNQHLSSLLGAGWDALPSNIVARAGQQHQYGLSIDHSMPAPRGPSSSSTSPASLQQLMDLLPSRLSSPANYTSGEHQAPSLVALELLQQSRRNKSSDVDRELRRLQQEQSQQKQTEDLTDRLRSGPTPAVAQLCDLYQPPPNRFQLSDFSDHELKLMQENAQRQLQQQQLQQKLLQEEIEIRDRMRLIMPGAAAGDLPRDTLGLLSQLSGNRHVNGQQNSSINQLPNRFIVDHLPPPRNFQGGAASMLPPSLQQLQHRANQAGQKKPSSTRQD